MEIPETRNKGQFSEETARTLRIPWPQVSNFSPISNQNYLVFTSRRLYLFRLPKLSEVAIFDNSLEVSLLAFCERLQILFIWET
jgi:hypothetical protein